MHKYYCFALDVHNNIMKWSHISDLYFKKNSALKDSPGLSLVPKLTYEHISLTSFSKMRVDLAK